MAYIWTGTIYNTITQKKKTFTEYAIIFRVFDMFPKCHDYQTHLSFTFDFIHTVKEWPSLCFVCFKITFVLCLSLDFYVEYVLPILSGNSSNTSNVKTASSCGINSLLQEIYTPLQPLYLRYRPQHTVFGVCNGFHNHLNSTEHLQEILEVHTTIFKTPNKIIILLETWRIYDRQH